MCICIWMEPPGLLYFTQLVNRFIRIFFQMQRTAADVNTGKIVMLTGDGKTGASA